MAKKGENRNLGSEQLGELFNRKRVDWDPVENAKKERENEIKKLQENSKKLTEILRTEEFTVKNILSQEHPTSFTPHSEMVMGGQSPVYDGGSYTVSYLYVEPTKEDIPVQRIMFNGKTNVSPGDNITALMPVYNKKVSERSSFEPDTPENRDREFYFDRPYKKQESAIEISVSREKGTYTERASDYHKYVSEQKE